MIDMVPVSSSLIVAIGFDEEENELHVEFKNAQRYIYEGVSRGAFDQLQGAESIGRFFLKNIKHYAVRKFMP